MRNWGLGVASAAALAVLVVALLPHPLIAALLIASAALLWWMARLDWWQRCYAFMLVLTIGATSTIGALVSIAEYGRYIAALLLLAITWFTSREIRPQVKSKLHRRMLIALWLVAIAAGASTVWSASRAETALNAVALAMLVAIVHLLSTRRWTRKETMIRDLSVAYIVLVASFVAGIAALIIGYADAENGTRFQGIYNNPNMLAQVAVVAAPLGWGLFRERPTMWRLAAVTPSVAVVFLSESRTAIIALTITAVVLVLRSSFSAILGTIYAAAILGCAMVATGWVPLSSMLDRFGSRQGGGALNGRLGAWESALDLVAEQPIGYGWAAGADLFQSLWGYASFTFTRTSVHNSYLQFLLELGVIGLLPFLYILVGLMLIVMRGKIQGLAAGLLGTIVAGSVVQMAESAMFGTGQSYPYIFWFAVAGALALYEPKEIEREKARSSPAPLERHRTS